MTSFNLDSFPLAGHALHVDIRRINAAEVAYSLVVEGDPGFAYSATVDRSRWDFDRREVLAHAIAAAALNTARNTLIDKEVYPERNT